MRVTIDGSPIWEEDPDEIGVGAASCPCGNLRLSNVRGTPYASMQARCMTCNGVIEVLPTTGGDAHE